MPAINGTNGMQAIPQPLKAGKDESTVPSKTMASTNGSTATSNGHAIPHDIQVTRLLSTFIANTTTQALTTSLRVKIQEVLLDWIGVVIAGATTAPSSPSILKGILALGNAAIPGATGTVLTQGSKWSPQYAGLLNATFGHSLDFDDTHADSTLHAGVTAIAAGLAEAEALGESCDSERFMLAVSIGYEITCRLGRELGYEAYSRGFHNTGTAGIFGAVATICVLRKLPADVVENALGLAGSKAAGSMQYLENGSWNKRLQPGFAVHDAFVCIALAQAGVLGAARIIEGKQGFLHAYSPNENKDLERLVHGLGEEWIWETSSLKPWAACRMTHVFIEMAGKMGSAARANGRTLKKIRLGMSTSNMILVGAPQRNKIHPENIVDAQFSAYFQAANAWIYGATFDLKGYTRLDDADIHNICDKIETVLDESCVKFGGTMEVEFADGGKEADAMTDALGEVSHPFTKENVEQKFLSLTEPVFGARAKEIMAMVYNIEKIHVRDLLQALR